MSVLFFMTVLSAVFFQDFHHQDPSDNLTFSFLIFKSGNPFSASFERKLVIVLFLTCFRIYHHSGVLFLSFFRI